MALPSMGKLRDGTFLILKHQTQDVITHFCFSPPQPPLKSALSSYFLMAFAALRYLPAAIAFPQILFLLLDFFSWE